MKKYWFLTITILFFISLNSIQAQSKPNPFFERNGTVSLQTTAMNALADTIATVNHRDDDIVWYRIVYRIIDVREKQNYQLYFPVTPTEEYRSLFRLILDAVVNDTLRAYENLERNVQPMYKNKLNKDTALINRLKYIKLEGDTGSVILDKLPILAQDPITNKLMIENQYYLSYAKSQMKFLTQEIVFFDKHTSRMYSKIIGIAPLYGSTETNISLGKNNDAWNYLISSVVCWFLFDELRPYLARQYVIPSGNGAQRLTYDEFFAQHLYSSYILGDSNISNRMLLNYLTDPEKIRKEQNRIETELLNFEQDLWEY